jgi:hypothetical protein
MPNTTEWLNLIPHPTTLPDQHFRVRCAVERRLRSTLSAAFEVTGSIDNIVWPDRSPSAFRFELWQTTCFELFVEVPGTNFYLEFNFSPSTQWSAMKFGSYRGKCTPLRDVQLSLFQTYQEPEKLSVQVEFSTPDLASTVDQTALRTGMAAVIEEKDTNITYWALTHPMPRPDFHKAQGFTQLIAPRKDA